MDDEKMTWLARQTTYNQTDVSWFGLNSAELYLSSKLEPQREGLI